MDKREPIIGVFSTQDVRKVGTGTTAKKSIHKAYWYCVESEQGDDQGKIAIQPLNTNYIPAGPKRIVEYEDFLHNFSPEPEFYISTVFPRMRDLNKTVARAERHRVNKQFFSAEMEFNNALKVDEENVRANFGLGLTYLQRNETDKADNIFARLVKLDAAFEPEHKHLFNEFGIMLRKNKMLQQAVDYYHRALELTQDDEHLYYNTARAYFEHEEIYPALEMLLAGLDLNPGLEEASRFLLWLINRQMIPDDKKPEVAEMLKRIKAAQQDGQGNAAARAEAPMAGNLQAESRATQPE